MRRLWFLLAIATLALILMPACGGSPSDPTGDDPPDDPPDTTIADWPEGLVGLREEMDALSDSALVRYSELRLSMGPLPARTTLVDELGGWDDIESAELLGDGSSIQLAFSDTTRCVLFTNERFFGDRGAGFLDVTPVTPATLKREVDRILGERTDCGDIHVPDNHKISIVNMAGGIRQDTQDMVDGLVQHLIDRGWAPEDIDVKQREGYEDCSFTADTMFDQSGYGLVFMMGMGGYTESADGTEYFSLECFRGGTYDERFEPYVTEERWNEYMQWYHGDGTLHMGKAMNDSGEPAPEVYVREDLLAEEMILDEGAAVHVLSCSGMDAADELLAAGAGNVTGWDGDINLASSVEAYERYLDLMMGIEGNGPLTDLEAVIHLLEYGVQEFDNGEVSFFLTETPSGNFMLPAQMSFDAPFDCLIEGTEYYDVSISYPDCPENNQSFQFFPGGDLSLTGLPPVGAEIELIARDAQGGFLGTDSYAMDLMGGPNEVELCPCLATLDLDIAGDEIPPTSSDLIAWFDYENPEIPGGSVMTPLPATSLNDLAPGTATVEFHAWNGVELVGFTTEEVEISCDGCVAAPCFGWLKFNVLECPEATTQIRVETGNPLNLPNPLVFSPDGQPWMLGFTTLEEAELSCTALDAAGAVLARDDQSFTITCGETLVDLEFDPYGVILEADPDTLPAEWGTYCEIKATVRRFTDFDTEIPTGPVVTDKLVTFETDLGSFWSEGSIYEMTTNGNGEAIVMLHYGDGAGTATVTASVDDRIVQSLPVAVTFLGPIRVWVDGRAGDVSGPPEWGDQYEQWVTCFCLHRTVWENDAVWEASDLESVHHYYHVWDYWTVGDSLTFQWEPVGDCADPEQDPPYNAPWMSDAYIHWYYVGDPGNQITLQLTPAQVPLSETVSVYVILTDPTRGGPPLVRTIEVPPLSSTAKTLPRPGSCGEVFVP